MAGALPDSGSREVSSFVETNASAAIRCWGPQGSAVQAGLANATAAPYLAAGGFRACTVLASGAALCSGADDVGAAANASAAGALSRDLFGYSLAVGDSHATFHLKVFGAEIGWTGLVADVAVIVIGTALAVSGTWTSLVQIFSSSNL